MALGDGIAFEGAAPAGVDGGALEATVFLQDGFDFGDAGVEAALKVFPLAFEYPEEEGDGDADEGDEGLALLDREGDDCAGAGDAEGFDQPDLFVVVFDGGLEEEVFLLEEI